MPPDLSASVLSASWADFGYRKVGPLPASGGGWSATDIVSRLIKMGDYHEKPNGWVRRHARRKGASFAPSIRILAALDRTTKLNDEATAFVDTHARSEWMAIDTQLPEHIRFRAEPDDLIKLVRRAETAKRWRAMHFLHQALFYIGPERLRPMLRDHVAPTFFRLYPEGRIVVLGYDTSVDTGSAMARIMYAASQSPISDFASGDFSGVQTMAYWHMASMMKLLPPLLDLFGHLFYPFVGSTCTCLPGLAFLFLPDPTEQHEPAPFPRNWLGLPGRSASFGRETADPVKIVGNPKGADQRREGHQRFCHPTGFSASERLTLLEWYIAQVNRLLYELMDVANFTENGEPEKPIDPVFAYEHQLTVDRLMRKTLTSMAMDEAPVGNLMAFEVADLYDTLSVRFKNRVSTTGAIYKSPDFFKALFNTEEGPSLIASRVARLPAPFGGYLSDLTSQIYLRIQDTVVGSVWRRNKVKSEGILVMDERLAREELVPVPRFVAEVMRGYRNAHHGYFSSSGNRQRPLRFLLPVNGNMPVEISALPALWWLAYLADPSLVGWNHLKIDAYDS